MELSSTWLGRWDRVSQALIIAAVGVAAAFALNALSFLGVIFVIAEMETSCAKEQIASRDVPRGHVRCHSLCALLTGHSHAAAAGGVSYLLHQLLLGSLASRRQRTQQEPRRVWFPARVLRSGCGAGRHCAAAGPVETFHRNYTLSRHGDIRCRHLGHGVCCALPRFSAY